MAAIDQVGGELLPTSEHEVNAWKQTTFCDTEEESSECQLIGKRI